MEPILYWYPVYYLNGEEPYGSAVVRKSGRIIPYQLKREPYEVDVVNGVRHQGPPLRKAMPFSHLFDLCPLKRGAG